MGKFRLYPKVEEKAALLCAPAIDRLAEEVAVAARRLAPPVKVWISMRDANVRDPHVKADGQTRPVNLRFALESFQWDMENRGVGPISYLLFPRDESSLCVVQLVNCRCYTELDYSAIRDGIRTTPAIVTGKQVTAAVVSEGEWVVEAEFGTVYPPDLHVQGKRYMGGAASSVARSRRARM